MGIQVKLTDYTLSAVSELPNDLFSPVASRYHSSAAFIGRANIASLPAHTSEFSHLGIAEILH